MSIQEAKEKHEHALLGLQNVVGVALGQKYCGGNGVGRIAIVVFVKVKVPETVLAPADIIPRMLEGYETDVIDAGGIFAFHG